jgi:hypothetical protein
MLGSSRRNDSPAKTGRERTRHERTIRRDAPETKGVTKMAEKEFEPALSTNVYIFAGVGALLLGGLGAAGLGGVANTLSAAVVGCLAGGVLGFYFK